MAYGDYYNPNNKSVTDGSVVYAEDVNKINTAVDVALDQVASDLDDLAATIGTGGTESKDWATEDAGTRPDPVLDLYSSRAYAAEAKGWAQAAGTITEASTGVPLAGSSSAKTQATAAAASASAASGFATTAQGHATTASGHATTASGYATTATNKAADAAASAAAALLSEGAAADSEAAVAALFATVSVAGAALIDDATAADQRTTLGLGNVDNTSDVDKPISTLTQAALDLKALIASPTFTGTPAAPTPVKNTRNTTIPTTAWVKSLFNGSANGNGYFRIPAANDIYEFLVQWGTVTTNATPNTGTAHTFPLEFTSFLCVVPGTQASNSTTIANIYNPSATGFSSVANVASATIRYIAVGILNL